MLPYICERATSKVNQSKKTLIDRRRTEYIKLDWDIASFAVTQKYASVHVVVGGQEFIYGIIHAHNANFAADALILLFFIGYVRG